MSRGGCLRPES
eukprot:gene26047-biopygen17919